MVAKSGIKLNDNNEKIIAPIDRKKLIRELTDDKFAGFTNKGKNEIYIFDYLQHLKKLGPPIIMVSGILMKQEL